MEKIVVNYEPHDYGDNHYNAQIWRYYQGTWWYTGEVKFLKTIDEVLLYAKDKKMLVEFR